MVASNSLAAAYVGNRPVTAMYRGTRQIVVGGGGAPLEYIGAVSGGGSGSASRAVAVHADTAVGDRVFVFVANRSGGDATSVDTVTRYPDAIITIASGSIVVIEVIAVQDTLDNGITVTGLSTNNNLLHTVTYRGGGEATVQLGGFGSTEGWPAPSGFMTLTWPTINPTSDSLYMYRYTDGNGARTWTRATEIAFSTSDIGLDQAMGVARQAEADATDTAVTMFTSVGSASAVGAYIKF